MTTTTRDKILARLRAANVHDSVAAPEPESEAMPTPTPNPAAYYAQRMSEDLATRVARLALNLSNAMAEVHRTSAMALSTDLVKVIHDKGLKTVAVGPEILARPDLCVPLQNACTLLSVTTPHATQSALFNEADAGLTLSHAAIADTGSIVLWSGAASPRLLSLVPPIHMVVVDARRTYDTLFDLLEREAPGQNLPTNMVLVSSPSKTADIQQTLAYGAHGPKQLVVMLVEETTP